MEIAGRVVHPGQASGPLLVLERPLSFWGGVDPASGRITDPRHPQHDLLLKGQILVIERAIGSSSSSAIMLELIRNDVAPAGVVVVHTDAILILGILVARELGYPTLPVIEVGEDADFGALITGTHANLLDGVLSTTKA